MGISPHVDSKDFGPEVVCVSLGQPTAMQFSKGAEQKVIVLPPNSLLVMKGPARYDWTHEIPYTKLFRWVDDSGCERVMKRPKGYRRVSITFRRLGELSSDITPKKETLDR
jgi:alkylated DNA repair dioxygenase AlkB